MHIGYVPFWRPPFSALISAPEHIIFTNNRKIQRASPFYSFCRSRDHHFQPVSWPPTAGLLRPARTRSVRRALRGYSGQECSPGGDHQFHAGACARDPHFSLRRGTYLPKCGSSAPPPQGARVSQNGCVFIVQLACVYLRSVCDYFCPRSLVVIIPQLSHADRMLDVR